MLGATCDLFDAIRAAPGAGASYLVTAARVAHVARHGTAEDADALIDVFLEDPADYRRGLLLDAVMRAGDRGTAEKLAAACLLGGRLKDDVNENVLHALGFLGHADAREALWRHAADETDYYLQKAAALGLLSLSCAGLEGEIEAAIRACVGKNLFPEFLPALAHKCGNPELLPLIFDLGRTTASTDCNGGIVYGVALFGEPGRAHFDQLLFDPHWECFLTGTGTVWWAYHGFRHLGGGLAALAQQLRAWHATLPYEEWEYRAWVWLGLANCWLADPPPPLRYEHYAPEPAADVYAAAFDWTADRDDALSGLVRAGGWVPKDEVYALRDRLGDRVAVEAVREV